MVDLGKRSIVRLPYVQRISSSRAAASSAAAAAAASSSKTTALTTTAMRCLFDNDAFSSGDVWPNNNIFISSIDDFHGPKLAASPSHISPQEPSRNLRLVKRRGQQLTLNGGNFRIAGPNIYWLRVREALAIAVAMGANTVRLMSCGVSVGSNNPYNLELSNGNWQDVAHGGKYSLLGFSGASTANKGAAFYTDANTINIYKQYIQKFLVRTNVYNGKRYADDPTIQAWETGNELGGTNGIWHYTTGATPAGLNYPRKTDILSKELGIASSAKKGFLIGEFDWTAAGGGVSRSTYLGAIEQSGSYLGSMIAATISRIMTGTRSTVLKAQNSAANQSNALLVVQHFYRLTGRSPPVSLPGVACPQPIF
ncbi:hypothetical protein JCM10295v2_006814 [Rhodotorula toruloides]